MVILQTMVPGMNIPRVARLHVFSPACCLKVRITEGKAAWWQGEEIVPAPELAVAHKPVRERSHSALRRRRWKLFFSKKDAAEQGQPEHGRVAYAAPYG